jgi:hypothetical protein
MFLVRYCTESARDPLQAVDTNFDGMESSLRNDYLKQVQLEHYRSDLVRTRGEALEKENNRNGTVYPEGEANCFAEESIIEMLPSEDQYGSSLDSSDDTTCRSQSGYEESTQRHRSCSSSEFSAPDEFLYSSMQTDVSDSRSCSQKSVESSSRRNMTAYVEQTTISISRREKDRLLRAKRNMIRNPKSLLGSSKLSLDYSCSYISSEESWCDDYDACGPIQEEDHKAVADEEDESYNSQSQPDRNYTQHLYAEGCHHPTSRGVNTKLAIGMPTTEETAKNLDEAFCMSMTEDGSWREESTLCEDLSDFGSSRSCLSSFGYGQMPDDGYNLLDQGPKHKTPKLQRHVNFPVTPSPRKSSKDLISAYLHARESRKSGGSKKNWLGFLQKSEAPGEGKSSGIVGAKTQEAATSPTSDPPTRETPSSNVVSNYLQARDPTNCKPADASRNQIIVDSRLKPDQQDPEVDDSKHLYKYQFSRPETPECSIDYANVIDEFLQTRGVVRPDVGETEPTRPLNLVQSERADVSALSNPSYLSSPKQSGHLELIARRRMYATIYETAAYELSYNAARPNGLSTENVNTFELQSPSTLTSASMVFTRNDISSSENRGDGTFAESIPTADESGDHLASWSEKRSDTDSYGFSIRNDDDDYTRRDYDATSSRHSYTYYDARDDEDSPRCMKACFPGVDRFACSAKNSGGYTTLEESPPRFLKRRAVTPRTDHSPFESPEGRYCGKQFEI